MDAATNTSTSNNRRTFLVLAIPVGLLLSGLLVWQASHAAFSDTTTNPGNSWAAGEVIITSDRATALFEAPNLAPGDGGAQCVRVTYSGTLDADVRLYGAYVGGDSGLAPYLDFDVEQGTGTAADCSDFTAGTSASATGTLASFVTTHTNFANGLGGWSPAPNTTRTYRFTYELPHGVSNDAQGESATASFTWEARNR
jgi:hypothetical protein